MIRKIVGPVVLMLSATTLLTGAPSASATVGGSCSIVVPPTVWVDRPYKLITATLAPDCAASGAVYASWDVRHSYYGPSDIFIFDNTTTASNGFYDWQPYGTYYVEPGSSWDVDSNNLAQNTRSYVVKSGSGLGMSSSRLGSYVTLSASTSYYSPAADGYLPWKYEKVTLQYRTCSTCVWQYLRYVYTNSYAKASYRFYAPRARYYRAVSAPTTTIWGRTSAVLAR